MKIRIFLTYLWFTTFYLSTVEGWTGATTISTRTDNHAPVVSINSNTHAYAAWIQGDNPSSIVQIAYFNGSNWGEPVTISSESNLSTVNIYIDDLDRVICLWAVQDAQNLFRYIYRVKTSITEWSAPLELTTGNDFNFKMVGSGTNIATWLNVDTNAVISSNFDFLTGWSAPVTVISNLNIKSDLQIVLNESGNQALCWREQSGAIYFSKKTSNEWCSPVLLSETSSNMNPTIAMNSDDESIVTWMNSDTNQILSRTISANNTLSAIYTISDSGSINPSICSGGSTCYAAWLNIEHANVQLNRYKNNTWELPINIGEAVSYLNPFIISVNLDMALILFSNMITGDLLSVSTSSTTAPSNPIRISDMESGSNINAFASSRSGKTIVTWESNQSEGQVIQVNIDF